MANLGAAQVSGREELAIVDRGEAVRLDPLPVASREVIDKQELVGAIHAVHCVKLRTRGAEKRGGETFLCDSVSQPQEK